MIIKDLKIKKGTFSLKCDKMDFSRKGVYLLSGENGSGKTIFLETILKERGYLSFKDKARSISYYSQKNYKYPLPISEYLLCNNKSLLEEYLNYFFVDYLNKNIIDLSGGEFVIVSLIRCLIKDTPIIILDEPTNNLDNGATEKLNYIIKKLSKTKTIIISTHDERLKLDYIANYYFNNGEINLKESS